MHQALITGASHGFGRALLGALVARGWACAVDARDATALNVATAGLANVRAVPGDVTDPGHRAALVAAAGQRLDLLVHNASALGPSPLPTLATYPLDALRRVYEVDVLAPVALTQLALPALQRASAPTVVVAQLRRRRRGLPGLGWLRLGEGGAGPHRGRPRRRAPGPARLRVRPRRHAYRDAPGAPSRARTSPTARTPRPWSPALLRLLDERPRQRPLPRRGPAGDPPMTRPTPPRSRFTLPPELGATEPPEQRGLARDEVRLLVAAADRPVRHALFRDLAAFLPPRRPPRGQHLRHRAPRRSTGAGADGRPVTVHVSATRCRTEATGSWSCAHPAAPRGSGTRAPARRCGCPAA